MEQDANRMADVVSASGLVEVMRDIVGHPDSYAWLATRLEIIRRIRTDDEFRQVWLDNQQHLEQTVHNRLVVAAERGRLRRDYSAESLQQFLELVLDGIIVRMSSGRSMENLNTVLDLVEESVRENS